MSEGANPAANNNLVEINVVPHMAMEVRAIM